MAIIRNFVASSFALGTADNVFDAGSGDKSSAVALRDAYASANTDWLQSYDDNSRLNIILKYTDTGSGEKYATYQVRIGSKWVDNTSAIGVRGTDGEAGGMSPSIYDPRDIEEDVFDRANHTGTQGASTISDFDVEVSNNTDVVANTTHRTSDGSDHTFVDQDVTTTSSPTFSNATIDGKDVSATLDSKLDTTTADLMKIMSPDVSILAPNKIVDSLSGSFDFTRSSTTGNINKSCILETLDVDEPAFTEDGLSVYENYKLLGVNSENVIGNWTIGDSGEASVVESSLSIETYRLSDSDTGFGNIGVTSSTSDIQGEDLTISFLYKSDYNFNIAIFGFGGTEGTRSISTKSVSTSTDFTSVSHTFTVPPYDENITIQIQFVRFTGSVIDTFVDFAGPMVVVSSRSNMPYMVTEDSTETRAADIPSIQNKNNLPSVGSSFTDTFNIIWNGYESFIGETETRGYGIYIDASGDVYLRGETTEGVIATSLTSDEKVKLTLTYDGTTCTGYVNGVLSASTTLPDITYSFDESFYIGRNYSGDVYFNSEIEDYKRWFSVLTDTQIALLGEA